MNTSGPTFHLTTPTPGRLTAPPDVFSRGHCRMQCIKGERPRAARGCPAVRCPGDLSDSARDIRSDFGYGFICALAHTTYAARRARERVPREPGSRMPVRRRRARGACELSGVVCCTLGRVRKQIAFWTTYDTHSGYVTRRADRCPDIDCTRHSRDRSHHNPYPKVPSHTTTLTFSNLDGSQCLPFCSLSVAPHAHKVPLWSKSPLPSSCSPPAPPA